MPAAPQVRTVPARVLTPIGWVQGSFTVPRLHSFVDHLDHAGPSLRLRGVRLPGRKDPVKTFVVQRNAVILVIPDADGQFERTELVSGRKVDHALSCLLQHGVVHGRLTTLASVPVAEFMLHHAGFVILRDAVIHLTAGAKPTRPTPAIPRLLVNAAHVIGVSES